MKTGKRGGFRKVPLGARVQFDPEAAAKEILDAFRDSGANLKATAERFGVAQETVHRWIAKLKLAQTVYAMRRRARQEGWLRSARWPSKQP